MLRDTLSWEGLTFLVFGVIVGTLYYNFYLGPRDAQLYSIMDCMNDQSRAEYDRCVQLQKK